MPRITRLARPVPPCAASTDARSTGAVTVSTERVRPHRAGRCSWRRGPTHTCLPGTRLSGDDVTRRGSRCAPVRSAQDNRAWRRRRDHRRLAARQRVCGGLQISSTAAIERGVNGEGDGRGAGRRPRRVGRCRNGPHRLERGMASSNSKKNLSALSRALDKYWDVSRPVARDGHERSPPVRTGEVDSSRQSHATHR